MLLIGRQDFGLCALGVKQEGAEGLATTETGTCEGRGSAALKEAAA